MTRQWVQQERGASFMVKLMLWLASRLGRRGVRWILYPTVFYFLLTAPRSVRASRRCLNRLLGRRATLWDVAKHFFAFSSCTQDRIFLLSNQLSPFTVEAFCSPGMQDTIATTPGCLLIVAHFGSTEALRLAPLKTSVYCMPSSAAKDSETGTRGVESLQVSILIDKKTSPQITSFLESLNPELAANLIDASERGPTLVLKLKEALQAGRLVGIAADRTNPGERAVDVQFMGATASMPDGPWVLAAALQVPVILGFGIYRGGARYETHFELFSERIVLPRDRRNEELQTVIQRYALRLEHYVRLAPYNWFNFYDYWLDDTQSMHPVEQ